MPWNFDRQWVEITLLIADFPVTFFTVSFIFLSVKLALNFGSAPISVAISVVAVLAEVHPVPPYCCREVQSLSVWETHHILFHWSSVSCLRRSWQINCRTTQQLLKDIKNFGVTGQLVKQLLARHLQIIEILGEFRLSITDATCLVTDCIYTLLDIFTYCHREVSE